MLHLSDIIQRVIPSAWSEGENIPWNEPGFSERMLKEHLSQDHDAASRRSETINRHAAWIYSALLAEKEGAILDLGCGPGLYAQRFARRGCSCTGIDFSPASIRYAIESAEREGLTIEYRLGDIRQVDYGCGYDLAMLIFGEFNVFKPADAHLLLRKMHAALKPGGRLLLEPMTLEAARRAGQAGPAWSAQPAGLFAPFPHLLLEEAFWDENALTTTTRYYIIEAASGEVTRHASSFQGYTLAGYEETLNQCGFDEVSFYPELGAEDLSAPMADFIALTAIKA
jgi:cyclopropane fatty-acyl-phospholipid synthase-like methyltransferase